MKTGTPVRIDGRSVDFSTMEEQKSENDFHKFSYLPSVKRELKQRSCWITYTSESVHEALREGLKDSPLYNGQIKSIGPRYCPSIETKIVTFAQKTSHQLFLEPEGENTNEYYLNGFSSSLPLQIQLKALQRIPAFKNVHIFRPGYAIEYDFFDPTQLYPTLETKPIKNLFFAGQINGTTGYEEAAGQGLIAGINAHINCHGGKPFVPVSYTHLDVYKRQHGVPRSNGSGQSCRCIHPDHGNNSVSYTHLDVYKRQFVYR